MSSDRKEIRPETARRVLKRLARELAADSMDNTRTHSMTADSTDSIRTDGTGSNRIRSTGNVGLC